MYSSDFFFNYLFFSNIYLSYACSSASYWANLFVGGLILGEQLVYLPFNLMYLGFFFAPYLLTINYLEFVFLDCLLFLLMLSSYLRFYCNRILSYLALISCKSQKVLMFISIELQQICYILLLVELDKLGGLLASGWVLAVRFSQEHLLGIMGVAEDVEF